MLFVVCCVLFVVCCLLLFVDCCLVFVVCCLGVCLGSWGGTLSFWGSFLARDAVSGIFWVSVWCPGVECLALLRGVFFDIP